MQIYINRNNEEFGPYSKEAVQEYIKHGVFQASDHATYVGTSDWKPISELLGIKDSAKPSKASRSRGPQPPADSSEIKRPSRPMRRSSAARSEHKHNGFLILLNVVLVAAGTYGLYMRFTGKGAMVRRYATAIVVAIETVSRDYGQTAATPAPLKSPATSGTQGPGPVAQPVIAAPPSAPAPVAEATPAPVAEATPEPVTASTPAPAPAVAKPFDPADLAASPDAWPKKVRLKQAVVFSALYNGQVVGSVTAVPGTPVDLVNIVGDQVTVSLNGSPHVLSWKLTDLEEEAVKRGWGVPSPAPSPIDNPPPAAAPADAGSAAPAATPPMEGATPAASPSTPENVPPPAATPSSTDNPPPPGS